MGILDDLSRAGRSVGGALASTGDVLYGGLTSSPQASLAGLRAGGRGVLSAVNYYNEREMAPRIFLARMAINHPEVLLDKDAFRQRLTESGQDPAAWEGINLLTLVSPAGFLSRTAGEAIGARAPGAPEQQFIDYDAMEESLASMPFYARLGAEVALDPTTYLGAGGVMRALSAGAARGGVKAGLSAAGKELAREAASMSMIPQAYRVAKLPLTTLKSIKGAPIAKTLAQWRAARTLADESIVRLTQIERSRLLQKEIELAESIVSEQAKLLPDGDVVRAAFKELDETAQTLRGDSLEGIDVFGQVEADNVTAMVGQLHSIDDETNLIWKHELEDPNLFERVSQKTPLVRRILSAFDPTQRLKVDPGKATNVVNITAIQRDQLISFGSGTARVKGEMLTTARRTHGMDLDEATGIFTEIKPKKGVKLESTFEDVMRWGRDKFELTDRQFDAWKAYHDSNLEVARSVRQMFEEPDVWVTLSKPQKAWVKRLGTADPKGGKFVPRVAKYLAEDGTTTADFARAIQSRSRFARVRGAVMRNVFSAEPGIEGFQNIRAVKRRLGAKQAVEFERELDAARDARKILFSTDLGESHIGYAEQILQVAADDALMMPTLKRLGIRPSEFPELKAAITKAESTLRVSKRIKEVAKGVRSAGATNARQLANIRALRRNKFLSQEVRDALKPLEDAADEFVASGPKLPGVTRRAARTVARTLRQQEGVRAPDVGRPPRTGEPLTPPELRIGDTVLDRDGNVFEILDDTDPSTFRVLSQEGTEASIGKGQVSRLETTFGDPAEAQLLGEPPGAPGVTPTERALRASAEASVVAQDTVAAQAALKVAARQLENSMNVVLRQAGRELGAAKEVRKASNKAASYSTVRRQVQDIPELRGRFFDNATAKEIERVVGNQDGAVAGFLKIPATVNAGLQMVQAGLDASFMLIQNLALLPTNPSGFAKATYFGMQAMGNPSAYAKYIKGLANSTDTVSGKSWLQLANEAKLSFAKTEMFAPGEALSSLRVSDNPLTQAVRTLDHMPWNRGWGVGRNVAAMEMFRTTVGLEQTIIGKALTTEQLRGVARQVDIATGVVSFERLGIQPTQGSVERLFGRFGAQWMRSQMGRLAQASNAGLEGRIARRVLMQQLGAMTIGYVAASHALGQTPNLDPGDRGKFLTLEHNGQRFGFSTPYRALMQTVVESSEALASGDTKRFATISGGKNPIFKFWKNGAPIIGGLVADIVLKINNDEERFTVFDEGWKFFTPFSVADFAEAQERGGAPTGAESYAASFFGASVFPQSVSELWREETQNKAKELGFDSWDDVPAAQQKELIRDNADLRSRQEELEKWQERFDSPTDQAFKQVEQSRAAVQDVLVPLWARVQAGGMAKSEYRQEFSELLGKQAFLADSVLGTIEEKERNEGEPLQDQLARKYQAIQPENFDFNEDGIIEEADWDLWRSAREAFWDENPEADQFREYIQVDFPNRVWTDPIMKQAADERRSAQSLYDTFLQLPKYQGLTADEGKFLDRLRSMASRAGKELGFVLAQRGIVDVSVPRETAWAYALQQLQATGVNLSAREMQVVQLAIVMDQTRDAQRQLMHPARAQFLIDNPLVTEWYPSAFGDAGLGQDEIAILGLAPQPLGTPLLDQATQLTGGQVA